MAAANDSFSTMTMPCPGESQQQPPIHYVQCSMLIRQEHSDAHMTTLLLNRDTVPRLNIGS